MTLDRFKRGLIAFNKSTSAGTKAFLGMMVLVFGSFLVSGLSVAYDRFKFNHLSSAEHLRIAKQICRLPNISGDRMVCLSGQPDLAREHLERIQSSAPEYTEASKILASIQDLQERHEQAYAKARAEAAQHPQQSSDNFKCDSGYQKVARRLTKAHVLFVPSSPMTTERHGGGMTDAALQLNRKRETATLRCTAIGLQPFELTLT